MFAMSKKGIMKKVIIINGEDASGKSFLAHNMELVFNNPTALEARGLAHGKFRFSMLGEKTDLLILDDVPLSDVQYLVYDLYESVYVERRGKRGITIHPQVIIITKGFDHRSYSDSFLRRVDVINTTIDRSKGEKLFIAEKRK